MNFHSQNYHPEHDDDLITFNQFLANYNVAAAAQIRSIGRGEPRKTMHEWCKFFLTRLEVDLRTNGRNRD